MNGSLSQRAAVGGGRSSPAVRLLGVSILTHQKDGTDEDELARSHGAVARRGSSSFRR